jgi:hypothetical protein
MTKELLEYSIVLDNGGIVKLTFPEDYLMEILESFYNAIKEGGLFNEEGWTDLVMKYLSKPLDVLNCKKVVGWF